jgi:hypothetical protein
MGRETNHVNRLCVVNTVPRQSTIQNCGKPGHDIAPFALRLAEPSDTIEAGSSEMYGRLQGGFKLFDQISFGMH